MLEFFSLFAIFSSMTSLSSISLFLSVAVKSLFVGVIRLSIVLAVDLKIAPTMISGTVFIKFIICNCLTFFSNFFNSSSFFSLISSNFFFCFFC